jgi:hypothetical protein
VTLSLDFIKFLVNVGFVGLQKCVLCFTEVFEGLKVILKAYQLPLVIPLVIEIFLHGRDPVRRGRRRRR